MAEPSGPLRVLSVVGAGRSGTTVLASILSEVPGCASAGELRWLWQRGIQEGRPCGCGRPPAECPVWAPVIARCLQAPGPDGDPVSVDEVVRAQHELNLTRNRMRVLRSANETETSWPALRLVRHVTGTAVEALAETTGTSVVVDTSKRPHDAAVMAAIPGVELYVLHVLRDPRAVAHSWRRAKTFSVDGETRTMGTRRLPSSVRRWTANALGSEALRRRLPPERWLRMRYEDFCASPALEIDRILAMLGQTGRPQFEGSDTVRLTPNHIVAGNPSRFTVGSVQIRVDEEWTRAMSRRDQLLVFGSTLPLLRRYGYAWRP